MKKVLPTYAFTHLFKIFMGPIMMLCLLLASNATKAQVIVETFEGTPWSTRATTLTTVSSMPVTVNATASKQTITTYSGNSSSQTATVTTAANNSLGTYTWFYSKGSISSASSGANSGHRKHSASLSFMIGSSSGYIIAPVISNGVASVSFWASTGGTSDLNVGVKTNVTNSNLSSSAVTLGMAGSAGFAAYTSIVGLPATMSSTQYVLTFSVTAPAQVVLFNNSGSTVYVDDIVIYALPSAVTLASDNPAVPAGNMGQGSTANAVYSFSLATDYAKAPAVLNSLNFVTTGTYSATDIFKFQLWYSSTNNIGTAAQVGTDLTTSLGAGTHTFSSLSRFVMSGSTGYFWVTADVAPGAVTNNTLAVSAITTADLSFSGGTKTGTANAGSTLTITPGSAASDFYRTRTSGNWSSVSTWESSADNVNWQNASAVPDNILTPVTISNGHTVTVNQDAVMSNLTVGQGVSGILQYENTTTFRLLTVNGNVTVATGGTFICGTQGATVNHVLTIGGSLVVNGTGSFDMTTATNTRAVETIFSSPSADVSIGGTTTNTIKFNKFTMSLGSASQKLVSTAANVTTNNSSALFNLVSGTLEIAGGIFTPLSTAVVTAGTTLSVITGGTFSLGNASLTMNGNLSVAGGTMNVGNSAGNSINYGDNTSFTMSSGTINIAGKFSYSSSANKINFNMSGGTMIMPTVDNSASVGTLDIPATGSSFTMSAGTIIIKKPSIGTTPIDYRNMAGTTNITGGTVQFGDATVLTTPSYVVNAISSARAVFPNLTISSTNSPTVLFNGGSITGVDIKGNLTIGAGATLNGSAKPITLTGNWVNSGGSFTNTGTTVTLNGTGTQTITGGETFNNLTVDKTAGTLNLTASGAVTVTGILGLANGTIDNSTNNISLGTGTTVDRSAGLFAANPIYGASVNVNYSGTASANSDRELTPASGTIGILSTSGTGGTYVLGVSPSVASLAVGTGSTLDAAGQVITNSGASTINGGFRTSHASGVAGSIAGAAPMIGSASTIEYYSGTAQSVDQVAVANLVLSGAGTKTFLGNTSISGNFSTTGGNVVLPTNITLTGASGTQSIAGLAYNDLTISTSGATKELAGSASIAAGRTLSVTAGTFDLTNNTLTLKSDATGTARVATVNGSLAYGSGGFVQERYVPGKASKTWSMVASPFTQSINSSWQQQVHITGAGTGGTICPTLSSNSNGFDATATNAASMFVYDGTKAVGARWTSVSGTGINLAPGTGYRMNIRGSRSAGCSLLDGSVTSTTAATLSSGGTLSNANKNLYSFSTTLPNNGDASPANDNYLLAGNPYPCEISFAALQTANNSVINNSYAIFAPGNTVGNYAFWNGATFTGGNTGVSDATGDILANGQAFFVQGAVAGADITLNWAESMKTTTGNNGYFRQQNPNRLRIGYMLANGNKADEIMVQFANHATSAELNDGDVISINAGTQYLKSLKAGKGLAFNTRNINFSSDTVHLNVVSTANGNFKLNFYDFEQFVQGTNAKIYLMDNYTGTVQLMNDAKEYAFTVTTSVPATQGTDRFAVVFSKTVPTVPTMAIASINVYPNPVTNQLNVELPTLTNGSYTITVTDIAGKKISQQKAQGRTMVQMKGLTSGTYLLEITSSNGERQVQRIVKQ